jgi:hypothetical protein
MSCTRARHPPLVPSNLGQEDGSMYPRRYIREAGTSVLIGLTPEETKEFESLDSTAPLGSDITAPDRLLSLYLKHQAAYEKIMSNGDD